MRCILHGTLCSFVLTQILTNNLMLLTVKPICMKLVSDQLNCNKLCIIMEELIIPVRCLWIVTQAGDLSCFKSPSCAKLYISTWYQKHLSKCPRPTGAIMGWMYNSHVQPQEAVVCVFLILDKGFQYHSQVIGWKTSPFRLLLSRGDVLYKDQFFCTISS